MAQIYLSSTYQDLKDQREQIRLELQKLGHVIVSMETYNAGDERPVEVCLADVARCELYIGILAWRYGFIPLNFNESITELEYRKAVETKKTCLWFLINENAPWSPKLMELPALEKINRFRKELREQHLVSEFSSSDELAMKVVQSVADWQTKSASRPLQQQLEWQQFETNYRKQLILRHGTITTPTVNGDRRKIPLSALYVTPNLTTANEKQSLELGEFVSNIKRAVVLGHPGAGKSTLASRISVDLGSAQNVSASSPLPILIIVREYETYRKYQGGTILDFIKQKARTDYQLSMPDGYLINLIDNHKVLVIFDGLDELVETVTRGSIVDDIDAFSNLYPLIRILVTSRFVGYEEAPLDPNEFSKYTLGKFTEKQTQEYVSKWFQVDITDAPQKEKTVATFNREIAYITDELKSNPLMLSLMCSIYQGEGYIPRNRPEIYRKCSELLFERRDRERGIASNKPIQDHLFLATLTHLANWIYGNSELENGVSERTLLQETTRFLQEKHFEDRDHAESVSRQFIEFCKGRAWVFTDTGTTKDGQSLYQFTHRTFLEYFTALFLIRTHRQPIELFHALQKDIESQQRIVVAEIAFQRMTLDVNDGANTLMTLLLEAANLAPVPAKLNYLSFAADCVALLHPRQSLVREVAQHCLEVWIDICVNALKAEIDDGKTITESYEGLLFFTHGGFGRMVFSALAETPDEYQTIAADVLQQTLSRIILDSEGYKGIIAAEIALNLVQIISHPMFGGLPSARWKQIENHIENTCFEALKTKHSKQSIRVAIDLFNAGRLSLGELIQLHGARCLFVETHRFSIPNIYDGELAPHWLSDLMHPKGKKVNPAKLIENIRGAGRELIQFETPWLKMDSPNDTWMISQSPQTIVAADPEFLFGTLIIMCFLYERWFTLGNDFFGSTEDFETPFPDYFRWIFIARLSDEYFEDIDERVEEELNKCQFSDQQKEFIRAWCRDEISLVNQR